MLTPSVLAQRGARGFQSTLVGEMLTGDGSRDLVLRFQIADLGISVAIHQQLVCLHQQPIARLPTHQS
jgi:hypothetical protein